MAAEITPCLRCGQIDRIVQWGFDTDFGGRIDVDGCQRCGSCRIWMEGERPEDGRDNPPSGIYVESELHQDQSQA